MASTFLASDFNNWISRINAVRTKSGIDLSALTLSVSQNTLAQSSTMSSLKSEILGMKTQTYLSYADYSSIENQTISSGTTILQSQKTDVETVVSSLEKICPNNSTTTNITSDYSTQSMNFNKYSTLGRSTTTDKTCVTSSDSTNSTKTINPCRTNSTYSNVYITNTNTTSCSTKVTCNTFTYSDRTCSTAQYDDTTYITSSNSTYTTNGTNATNTTLECYDYSDNTTYTDTTNTTCSTTSNTTYTVNTNAQE